MQPFQRTWSNVQNQEIDGKFIFKGIILSRLPNPVELSPEWVLEIFKYQEPDFYSRFFDESEKGPFEVSAGCANKYGKISN